MSAAAIPRRPVGRTGLSVPELGFGAAPLGNLYHPVADAEARATLDAALAAGLRYVDTAPHYGRGLAERRVGEALRLQPDVTISTKVGRLLDADATVVDDRERDSFYSPMPFRARYDYSHDGVLRSHEASLQRLGLARVDILYVHDIGGLTHGEGAAYHWEQLTVGGGFRALERLRDEGAIAAFGVGVNEVAVCRDALEVAPLDVILLAGRYTLLEQAPLDALFPLCAARGVSIVAGGPYNSGVLATGVKRGGPVRYDYAPAADEVLARVAAIEAVTDRHGVPLPAVALAFVLAHPAVASVIPGVASPAQVAETAALHALAIHPEVWTELKAEGLVRADAPTPGAPS